MIVSSGGNGDVRVSFVSKQLVCSHLTKYFDRETCGLYSAVSDAVTNNFVFLLDFSYWVILCGSRSVVWSTGNSSCEKVLLYIFVNIIPEFLVGPSLGLLNLTLV